MIRYATIEIAEPKPEMLTGFKQYASVPDDSRDGILVTILKRSLKAIQDYSNKTLLASTLEVTETEREENSSVRLYGYPSQVVSVKDGKGQAIGYSLDGDRLQPEVFSATVVVRYKATPVPVETVDLLPIVYRYGTALYDGADSSTLNSILAEITQLC